MLFSNKLNTEVFLFYKSFFGQIPSHGCWRYGDELCCTYIRRGVHGMLGVFASMAIERNEIVAVISGRLIAKKLLAEKYAAHQHRSHLIRLFFKDEDTFAGLGFPLLGFGTGSFANSSMPFNNKDHVLDSNCEVLSRSILPINCLTDSD